MDLKTIEELQLRIEREFPTEDDWKYMRSVVGDLRDELKRLESLKERAADYDSVMEYVESLAEGDEEEFWDRLERILDSLDAGHSDVMEMYQQWHDVRRQEELDEKRFKQSLFIAAHSFRTTQEAKLANPLPSMHKGEQVAVRKELDELWPALEWLWEQVKP